MSLGVGRILHWVVSTAAANGLDSPTTEGDLEDLTGDWTVPNDGIDLFVPHNMNIPSNGGMILGKSAIDGPCDKNGEGDDRVVRAASGATSRWRARSRTSSGTTSGSRTTTATRARQRPRARTTSWPSHAA